MRNKNGANSIQSLGVSYSEAQMKIISEDRPVKQVIAAAGSGKTSTIIGLLCYRLSNNLEKEGRVLLLSFSRKAVQELRDRLPEQLRKFVEISTFHSFCFRHLVSLASCYEKRAPEIISDVERNVFMKKEFRKYSDTIGGIPFSLLQSRPDIFEENFPRVKENIEKAYRDYKKENFRLDYEDLIDLFLLHLKSDDVNFEKLRRSYDLIVVDEFQDTDPRQLDFLSRMSPERVVVVGDDYQAIYGFRNCNTRSFIDFHRTYKNAKRYFLTDNYRSTSYIANLGNRVIKASRDQIKKKVRAVKGKNPSYPVRSIEINSGEEMGLVRILGDDIKGSGCMFLCRSNYRRRVWLEAGVPEDMVMTIHKSKGLEFPVVFFDLIGGWGGWQTSKNGKENLYNEEIRVAYVGITRAMNLLIIVNRPQYDEKEMEYSIWEKCGASVKEVSFKKLRAILKRELEYRLRLG